MRQARQLPQEHSLALESSAHASTGGIARPLYIYPSFCVTPKLPHSFVLVGISVEEACLFSGKQEGVAKPFSVMTPTSPVWCHHPETPGDPLAFWGFTLTGQHQALSSDTLLCPVDHCRGSLLFPLHR